MKNLKSYMTIGEAARFLGVTEMTLRRWDRAGKLKSYRNPANNYRLYKESELKRFLKAVAKKTKG
jgi:excisionase family DNA binding protein